MIQEKLIKNNKAIYIFSLIIASLYNVLLLPIITAELSIKEYSNYIVVLQIIGFFQAVLGLTYIGGTLKFWHDLKKEEREDYINSILFFLFFITLIITVGIYIFANHTSYTPKYLSGLSTSITLKMNLLIVVASLKLFLLTYFRVSIQPLKHLLYAIIYFTSLTTLLFIIYFSQGINLENLLRIILISDFLGTLYLLYHYRKIFSLKINLKYLLPHFKFSWALALSSLSFVVFQNIDRVLIKNNLADITLNMYSTALTLSLISTLIVKAIVSSDFPYLKKLSSRGELNDEIYIRRKNDSLLLLFICLLYLTVINDLVFYFFSKSYYSYNTIFCLNLFGIANFFRLKYLFTENRIFNIDRVSQILFAKLLILILGILMFNLTFDFDVLIIFPLVYILIFFTVNIFMNILWRKNHQSKEKFDLINFSLGFVLIAVLYSFICRQTIFAENYSCLQDFVTVLAMNLHCSF